MVNYQYPKDRVSPYFFQQDLKKKRMYAFTIDLFAVVIFSKFLVIQWQLFLSTYFAPQYQYLSSIMSFSRMEAPLVLGIYFFYFTFALWLTNGRTLGKGLLGLRVRRIDGEFKLDFADSFRRSVGYLTCYFSLFFFFAIPFINPKQHGIQDWVSFTENISEDEWQETKDFLDLVHVEARKFSPEIYISGMDDVA